MLLIFVIDYASPHIVLEASDQAPSPQQASSPVIAVSALEKEGDSQNRALLTEQSLHLYFRGKGRAFSLEYLQRLALEHRKLWFPLIGGGILASLCLLTLLHTFTIPYRLLAGATLGVLGMWWGYRGSMALVVYEANHHTDFLLREVAQNLPIFLAFSNRIIRRYPHSLGTYSIQISEEQWQQLQQHGSLVLPAAIPAIPLEYAMMKLPQGDSRWVAFDPFRLGSRLQWSMREQELVSLVSGTIYAYEVWQL